MAFGRKDAKSRQHVSHRLSIFRNISTQQPQYSKKRTGKAAIANKDWPQEPARRTVFSSNLLYMSVENTGKYGIPSSQACPILHTANQRVRRSAILTASCRENAEAGLVRKAGNSSSPSTASYETFLPA